MSSLPTFTCLGWANRPKHEVPTHFASYGGMRCFGCGRAAHKCPKRRYRPPPHVIGSIRLAADAGHQITDIAYWADITAAQARGVLEGFDPWGRVLGMPITAQGITISARKNKVTPEEMAQMILDGKLFCPGLPDQGRVRHIVPKELTKATYTTKQCRQSAYCMECERIRAEVKAGNVPRPRYKKSLIVIQRARDAAARGIGIADIVYCSGLPASDVRAIIDEVRRKAAKAQTRVEPVVETEEEDTE